jgi:hypothetical protein
MADLVFCLRHGEKPANAEDESKLPDDDAHGPGFDVRGHENRHALTIRGWQRAGALAATQLCGQLADPSLVEPIIFLVPRYTDDDGDDVSASHRPYQTVLALARRTDTFPNPTCQPDDTNHLRDLVKGHEGTVVVCWEHKQLRKLAKLLTGEAKPPWAGHEFDLIWRFTRDGADHYRLEMLPQDVLAPDDPSSAPVAPSR